MPDSLLLLEKRRSELLAELAALGDFRRGSISVTSGRCGTSGCHCHKPDDPGHGPNPRLTYKVEGKTVTESFPDPAAQRKAEREIASFRTYQELSRTLIETNEQICHARPVGETLSPQEKKRRKRSARKSSGKRVRCSGGYFRNGTKPAGWIWKRWRWPCGPQCTKQEPPLCASCCATILPLQTSAICLAPVAGRLITARCAHVMW